MTKGNLVIVNATEAGMNQAMKTVSQTAH